MRVCSHSSCMEEAAPGRRKCHGHLLYDRKAYRKHRDELQARGLCIRCKGPSGGLVRCASCRALSRDRRGVLRLPAPSPADEGALTNKQRLDRARNGIGNGPCVSCGRHVVGHPRCRGCEILLHAERHSPCACGESHGIMGEARGLCKWCSDKELMGWETGMETGTGFR